MTEHTHRQMGKFFRALMHVPVPWVFVLTYLIGVALEYACFRNRASSSTFLAADIGIILFVAGAALGGWGWLIFRKARTTRVPGEASGTLVTWGPYRFTRNPMYLGLIIAYLGEAGILRQLWPVLLLPLIFAYLNWVVIPVEEERLHQVFETRYEAYRTAVERWF